MTSNTCTVTRAEAHEGFWIVAEKLTPLVTAEQTSGAYDVVSVLATPNGGPPPHVHHREDELFYIIDGNYRFILNDQTFTAGPGAAVFLPRDIVHTYNNIGDHDGQILVAGAPANFARFIAAAGFAQRQEAGPAVFEKLAAACQQFELQILPEHQADQPAPVKSKPREFWVAGLHIKLLLTSRETNGSFSVAEITGEPGKFVPPHTHNVEDEFFYVTDGEFEFQLDDKTIPAPRGTFIHVPKQTLHGFRNVSNRTAKLVDYHTPGGFENFFIDAGTECTDASKGPPSEPLDIPRFIQICERHGMKVSPPKN